MSQLLDEADERIRSALLHLPVGDDRTADVLPAVRAGARVRRNRRRAVAITGAVVALGLAGFSVAGRTDDQPVLTASAPETPTTATNREYPPLTPLADGPLPVVPMTTVIEYDGYVHSIESQPGRVILRDLAPGGGGASSELDPETAPALELFHGSWNSDDPDRKHNVLGITRADVVRVEWIVPSGTLDADTFELPEFPQLRFFFIEDPDQMVKDVEHFEPPHVIAYGADGAVLADSRKIWEYQVAHADEVEAREVEVDRRRGVEVKDAGFANARVEHGALSVETYKCEGDPLLDWTEDDTAIKLSATVKRPIAEGACLSGDTKAWSIDFDDIGFSEPVGDRPIIDALTGEVLLEGGSGL